VSVRSGVLGRGQQVNAGVDFQFVSVPAGETYIVKNVHVWNRNALQAQITVEAADTGFAQLAALLNGPLASGQIAEWSGFFCLKAGDQLVAQSDKTGVYFWASGAALVGSI
jgi:hypothetical protein